jgi:cell division protein FtsZ
MSELLFEFDEGLEARARILVVGVGGAGGNAVDRMVRSEVQGVEFAVINTDVQALGQNAAPQRIQIGKTTTKGLGAGANPERAREAVAEDAEEVRALLAGAEMVFVTAGMGGGTGTGAAPEVARMAREAGALTVGVVTRPFTFEGRPRMRRAEEGIETLREQVDTLILVPNQRLMAIVDHKTHLRDAFRIADEVLMSAVRGISDLITIPGLINLDFADVREVMRVQGRALMGFGVAQGEYAAQEAAERAISSPLLDDASVRGARKLLVNITGGESMTLADVNDASTVVIEAVGDEAEIFLGAVTDAGSEDRISVTVIATGIAESEGEQPLRPSRGHRSRTADLPLPGLLEPVARAPRRSGRMAEPASADISPRPGTIVINWAEDGGQEDLHETVPAITRLDHGRPAAPRELPRTTPARMEPFQLQNARREEDNLEMPTFLRRTMD